MINFVFELRNRLLMDLESWYSTDEFKCGTVPLEFSIYTEKGEDLTESVQEIYKEFLLDMENIFNKVKDEIEEKYERLNKAKIHPHDKLLKDTEESLALAQKMMAAFTPTKNLEKEKKEILSAIPPREDNDNLTFDQFLKESLILACIAPCEHEEIIELHIKTPHTYTSQDIVMVRWYKGNFISDENYEKLLTDKFNSQEGVYYKDLKFVNVNKPDVMPEDLEQLEQKVGLKLPQLYRDFLLVANGGVPAIEGEEVPTFYSLDYLNQLNLGDSLKEYCDVGFFSISDVSSGHGKNSIYCQEGEHYGKIFSWHWDDCLEPEDMISKTFLKEDFRAASFLEYLEQLKNPSSDDDENRADVLEWLKGSKERTLSTLNHKQSVSFLKKLYKEGVEEIYVEYDLDDEDEYIDSFEINIPDDKDLRLKLLSFFEDKNWEVDEYDKQNWTITANEDYEEDIDELMGDWKNLLRDSEIDEEDRIELAIQLLENQSEIDSIVKLTGLEKEKVLQLKQQHDL